LAYKKDFNLHICSFKFFTQHFYKKQLYSSEIYSIWNNAEHGGTFVSPAADFRSIELLDPLTSGESIFIDAGSAEISTALLHEQLQQQNCISVHDVNFFKAMHCSSPCVPLSAFI
jgi:hypothetical protein